MRYLATAPDRPRLEGVSHFYIYTLGMFPTRNSDICVATSITMEDVYVTLTQQEMITVREVTPPRVRPSPGQSIKFPKGRKNGVARRHLQRTQTAEKANNVDPEATKGPFVPPTQYEIRWDRETVTDYLRNWESKGYLQLKPEKLQWSPYILAKTHKTEAMSAADTSTLVTTAKLAAQGLVNGNGVVTNGNGAHADSSSSTNGRSTPNGVVVPRIGSPVVEDLFGELPTEFPARSASADDEKGVQMERDRELATRLAADTPRTLRSRSGQRSLPATPSRGVVDRPRRGQMAEKGKGKEKQLQPTEDEEDNNDDDAVEEEGRHLRSRGYAPGLLLAQSSPSTPSRRVPPPKKRRRVESSPEDDSSPSMPPVPLRTPSPALNGDHRSPTDADSATCAQEPQRNGFDATRQPVGAVCTNSDELRASNPAAPIIKTIVVQTGDRDATAGDTVKSEDLGTPLTSFTGRQSEDTVVTVDPAPPVNGKVGGLSGAVAIVAAAWEHTKPAVQEDTQMPSEDEVSLGDAEGDADAEGEEDDAEGSVDVDMG
jgi:hypothetical protein